MGLFSNNPDPRHPKADPDNEETTVLENGKVRRIEKDDDGNEVQRTTWW